MKVSCSYLPVRCLAFKDLPEEKLAADNEGNIYVRLGNIALCLNPSGTSFTGTCHLIENRLVTLLPPGATVILEQEADQKDVR